MQPLEQSAITSLSASDPDSSSGPSKHFALFMALACAVTVANLYYAQPLLQQFAATFHASIAKVGVVPSAVQIGYAGGLLFLGPLGDRHARHRLILGLGALLPLALLAAAAAPSVLWLAFAMLAVGLLSSIIQQIIPLVAQQCLHIEVGFTADWRDTPVAIEALLGRRVRGNVVLEVEH